MFRELVSRIQYPQWAGRAEKPSRWRTLDQLDRVLFGCIYDHLVHDFYQERLEGGSEAAISLRERRPSAQYNLPMMVSRWAARKLWAGRHIPRIAHKDRKVTKIVDQIIQTTGFFDWMMTATIMGSVGSVAITFRVDNSSDEPQVGFRVWRARDCIPKFDDFGNLVQLRVSVNVYGRELIELGLTRSRDGEPVRKDQQYWWFRVFTATEEQTLLPARVDDWNPVEGWTKDDLGDSPVADLAVTHDLGFVPGVWVRNLAGKTGIDGKGTWDLVVNNTIEIDYLLSQASRGTRYNCAPTPVIVGELQDQDPERSPNTKDYLHLRSSRKEAEGETIGEGSASLMEMTGNGIKAAQDQISALRNMTLESIGATRKDPEKLKGVMSGRAMEFLDEDSHDLVMELRSSYGRAGLELMRKVCRASGALDGSDPKGLTLKWPRLYQPTPEDLAHMIPALVLAATPIQEPLDPETAAAASGGSGGGGEEGDGEGDGQQVHEAETRTNKSASGASTTVKKETKTGPAAAGGGPSATPTGGEILGALLTVAEASEFLKIYMDIGLMPDADEDGITDSDEPTSTVPPPLGTHDLPNETTV